MDSNHIPLFLSLNFRYNQFQVFFKCNFPVQNLLAEFFVFLGNMKAFHFHGSSSIVYAELDIIHIESPHKSILVILYRKCIHKSILTEIKIMSVLITLA